jgi:hypothetical protein
VRKHIVVDHVDRPDPTCHQLSMNYFVGCQCLRTPKVFGFHHRFSDFLMVKRCDPYLKACPPENFIAAQYKKKIFIWAKYIYTEFRLEYHFFNDLTFFFLYITKKLFHLRVEE